MWKLECWYVGCGTVYVGAGGACEICALVQCESLSISGD